MPQCGRLRRSTTEAPQFYNRHGQAGSLARRGRERPRRSPPDELPGLLRSTRAALIVMPMRSSGPSLRIASCRVVPRPAMSCHVVGRGTSKPRSADPGVAPPERRSGLGCVGRKRASCREAAGSRAWVDPVRGTFVDQRTDARVGGSSLGPNSTSLRNDFREREDGLLLGRSALESITSVRPSTPAGGVQTMRVMCAHRARARGVQE